jgi:hypothetical protein
MKSAAPVRPAEAQMASMSTGHSERRSITSHDRPAAPSRSAASSATVVM